MKRHPKQRGFTLVETLIGLTIGIFLLFGVASVFSQSRQTYNYQLAQAGQQGNERLSAVILTTALEQAGFAPMNAINIVNRTASFPGDADDSLAPIAGSTCAGLTGGRRSKSSALSFAWS